MDNNTVLVLANPADRHLAMLEELPPETSLVVGDSIEAFDRAAADATVLFNWELSSKLFHDVFLMCPHLKWVHTRSAGIDTQLFPELVASPVPLTNGSGIYSASLGEFALAAILYFAKDLRRMLRNQMAGVWEQFDVDPIEGATLGIVGYGDIGKAAARRAKSCGMRVLALNRTGPPLYHVDPVVEKIYGPDARLEMIGRCDYLVISLPLTSETRHMIGEPEFAAMKESAVVINIGRGPVVDEAALIRALRDHRIKGAALDVFEHEPLPADHPFYQLENVLLSPHCADHTPDWMQAAMRFFLQQFERFHKHEPLLNIVDKHRGY